MNNIAIFDNYIGRYLDEIEYLRGKKVYLFDSGGVGRLTASYLVGKGINVVSYLDDDDNLIGSNIEGLPINSIKNIHFDSESIILITMSNPINSFILSSAYCEAKISLFSWAEEGFYDLSKLMLAEVQIACLLNRLEDSMSKLTLEMLLNHRKNGSPIISSKQEQYFDDDIIKLDHNIIFVDGGAFTGDTISSLKKHLNNDFNKIYAFEPNLLNYQKLVNFQSKNIITVNKGIYSKSQTMKIKLDGSGSKINEQDGITIEVESLDDYFMNKSEKPSFIKLDIEGSEIYAIKGMSKLLLYNKPILAISIYHKYDDLWKIPNEIIKINPSYRLYIRHYSDSLNETVCYAL